jgi:hypothetical protein
MDLLDKKTIVIANCDNGFNIYLYEGPQGTPASKQLIAKTWGEVITLVQSMDLSLPKDMDVDTYMRDTFKMDDPPSFNHRPPDSL